MIRVAEWGTGMMGQGLLGFILDRPKDIDLVGVIVTNPAKEGKTVGELLGRPCDVTMTTDFASVLVQKPDVVCINTQSNLHEITGQVVPAVEAGCNVICIAEKLSYPWASDPAWADRIDALAREHGVTVLGTGINPGFMLDALIVMWSSICLRVDRIVATRVNDLSPFGPTVMNGQGVGTTVERVRAGRRRRQHRRPHRLPREHPSHRPRPGLDDRPHRRDARADRHHGRALDAARARGSRRRRRLPPHRPWLRGRRAQDRAHPPAADPPRARGRQETGDYVEIHGDPDVNMANKPEIPGGKGTYASTGNYIPLMKDAPAGMLTVVDMPLPRFWTPV